MGTFLILWTPIWILMTHDVRAAIVGIAAGLTVIAAGTVIRQALVEGAIISGTIEVEASPTGRGLSGRRRP